MVPAATGARAIPAPVSLIYIIPVRLICFNKITESEKDITYTALFNTNSRFKTKKAIIINGIFTSREKYPILTSKTSCIIVHIPSIPDGANLFGNTKTV